MISRRTFIKRVAETLAAIGILPHVPDIDSEDAIHPGDIVYWDGVRYQPIRGNAITGTPIGIVQSDGTITIHGNITAGMPSELPYLTDVFEGL